MSRDELIKELIKLSDKLSRPSKQLPYDYSYCLVDTDLIFKLRVILKELKKTT